MATNIKPIKTLPVSSFTYQILSPSSNNEKKYQITSPQVDAQFVGYDKNNPTVPSVSSYYDILDVKVGDWFCDILTNKLFQISSINISTSPVTIDLIDTDRFEEFTDEYNLGGFGLDPNPLNNFGLIFELDSSKNPLLNIPLIFNNYPSLGSNILYKFRSRYPLSKVTHNIFSNFPVSTGAGSYSQYNLGVFSCPATITGKFYVVTDLVYSSTSPVPPSFNLNVRKIGDSSTLLTLPLNGFNTLTPSSLSKTLDASSIYEFYLTSISSGIVSNITVYFIED